MHRKNDGHLQLSLDSDVQRLSEKQRRRLEQSWAGAFYAECFCRIREERFAVLYAPFPSRPNTPVNVLVGLEMLKAGFGWSDEELYDAFTFNVQVRYALGYRHLGEGDFDIRTLYYFRQRLACYHQEHGVNLLDEVFQMITDQQLAVFKVRTGIQRVDSTQIASNIRDASRLQLAVEAVRRLHRLLDEKERAAYVEWLAPYVEHDAEHYAYQVKGQGATHHHLEKAGLALHSLLREMEAKYQAEVVYQVVQRFFQENYRVESSQIVARTNKELSSGCLQSLDDLEASYRQKAKRVYKGYVASASETCDPQNGLQLITRVQVAPNNVQDADLLRTGLPSLKERTDVQTMVNDAAYCGPEVDEVFRDLQVVQVPTNMLGQVPNPERFTLMDFAITTDGQGNPQQITCPGWQTVTVGRSRTQRFTAAWDGTRCRACLWYAEGRCRGRLASPRVIQAFT